MPELPEVQTVLDTLATKIKDLKIIDIKILYKPIILENERTFKKRLINQHFRAFKRRGKYLLFEMDDLTLVSHLRMEGKYYIYKKDEVAINKHTHVIFYLENNLELHYNDVRKFGRMELIPKEEKYDNFKNLGKEPFTKDFNLTYCKNYFKNNKHSIKQELLNQHFIAGIGNIYADEIIFAMKVHPKTTVKNLDDNEIKTMIKATNKILKEAIQKGGTTIRSYTSSLGVTGKFQLSLKCHNQKECPICKSEIKKIVVASRGTYFCPHCQKEK